MDWWRDAVIYQVFPRSFRGGTLAGVAEGLPHVADLGVDAVWLSPVFVSPMRDCGYDVADFRAVDPAFGTLADFDRVVETAHRLGLKLILDQVWSHSSDRHPWFRQRPEFYVWADPRPDGTPPNNWLSVFGGPAWSWDPRRRQYYLHHFLPCQPAFDWRNPALAAEVMAAGAFWLERGVDGFRLDAVDFLLHDPSLRDNPARPLAAVPAKPFGMQDHRFDMAQPGVLPLLSAIRTLLERHSGTMAMAELSSDGDPFARAALATLPGHLHTAYTLGLMRRPGTAAGLNALIAEVEAKVPAGTLVWAFSNHDVVRTVTRWGDGSAASAKMLLGLLLSMRGGICLYQGEELGLPEADIPYDRLTDPYGLAFWPEFRGRDGCRTPIPWTADTPGVEPCHRGLAVDGQRGDPGSTLETARRLLRFRRDNPALRHGGLALVELDGRLVAFEREAAGERLLCLFNPGPDGLRIPLPAGRLVEGLACRIEGDELVLDGWGAAWLAR